MAIGDLGQAALGTMAEELAAAGAGSAYREFRGKNEFPSNLLHGILAIAMWIGSVHFDIFLLLFSFLFLPFSKFLVLVLFSFLFLPFFNLIFLEKKEFKWHEFTCSVCSMFTGWWGFYCFSWFFLSTRTVNLAGSCLGTLYFFLLLLVDVMSCDDRPNHNNNKLNEQVYMQASLQLLSHHSLC